MRKCSECKKRMDKGYILFDGEQYYCSDECLHKHYSEEEYQEIYDEDNGFYTVWED